MKLVGMYLEAKKIKCNIGIFQFYYGLHRKKVWVLVVYSKSNTLILESKQILSFILPAESL